MTVSFIFLVIFTLLTTGVLTCILVVLMKKLWHLAKLIREGIEEVSNNDNDDDD